MASQAQLLPGTLDLLILKAISLGSLHGYGILLRISQISRGALLVEQGALYPALFRLVHRGLLKANWGTSDNNRRAKDRKSTRLNSSHQIISYAVFCLKKKNILQLPMPKDT